MTSPMILGPETTGKVHKGSGAIIIFRNVLKDVINFKFSLKGVVAFV